MPGVDNRGSTLRHKWPGWRPDHDWEPSVARTAGSVTAVLMLGCCCWAQHHHRSHHNTTAARSEYVLEVFIDYKMCHALKFSSYFVHEAALLADTPALALMVTWWCSSLPSSPHSPHLVTMTHAAAREAPRQFKWELAVLCSEPCEVT